MRVNGFTPTQARILQLLSDGRPHMREEIHECLDDDLAQLSAIKRHLSDMRKHLHPIGETIACVLWNGKICYQQFRLLPSANDGRA